jgi:hypothetical protein
LHKKIGWNCEKEKESMEKVQGIAFPKQVVLSKNLLFCLSQGFPGDL